MKTNKKQLTFKQRLALVVYSARFNVYYINPQLNPQLKQLNTKEA